MEHITKTETHQLSGKWVHQFLCCGKFCQNFIHWHPLRCTLSYVDIPTTAKLLIHIKYNNNRKNVYNMNKYKFHK